MAQAGPSSMGRQNLVCAVCREVYRSPRLLPYCHHSFCLGCLEGLAGTMGRSFPCPTCRTVVRVPTEGVHKFPVNFYILEEDLEHERNQAFRPLCATHGTEELIFFCKQCDEAICIRCKLTRHDHHQTLDLWEAADHSRKLLKSSKKRVDKSVRKVTKASALCQDNCRAAQQKTDRIRQQIREHYEAVVMRVTEQRDQALDLLKRDSRRTSRTLQNQVKSVQQDLDSLIQLNQEISYAIDSGNDAEVVVAEKEVREGKGSVEELEKVEAGLPTKTQWLCLHGDFKDLAQVDLFGTVDCQVLPFVAAQESITPVYRCKDDRGCHRVHALGCEPGGNISVLYGFRQSAHLLKRLTLSTNVDEEGGMEVVCASEAHSSGSTDKEKDAPAFLPFASDQPVIHLRSNTDPKVIVENKQVILRKSGAGLEESKDLKFGLQDASRLLAVDADWDRQLLVVLSEDDCPSTATLTSSPSSSQAVVASPASKKRRVLLYAPNKSNPVSYISPQITPLVSYASPQITPLVSYTSPQITPFFPTDVCFWRGGEDPHLLLISDKATDCVHVVSVASSRLTFLRYLAHGSPDLLRPTALDCVEGKVWIGCENGWIMRCEKDPGLEDTEEMEEEEEEEEEDGEEARESGTEGSRGLLLVENGSGSTLSVNTVTS